MSIVEHDLPPLQAGDFLTRDEFLRRWEAMPHVRRAELIGGTVYMPSPLSIQHGEAEGRVGGWLSYYAAHTPGCATGHSVTWFMGEDAPQPDVHLRLLPEFGGQSSVPGRYPQGAPELAVEICLSSSSYDLHQKMALYLRTPVPEYLAILLREQEVRWHRLTAGTYQKLEAGIDGILRSGIFPGLWLHAPALLAGDMRQVLATLDQGLHSPEHLTFRPRLRE